MNYAIIKVVNTSTQFAKEERIRLHRHTLNSKKYLKKGLTFQLHCDTIYMTALQEAVTSHLEPEVAGSSPASLPICGL